MFEARQDIVHRQARFKEIIEHLFVIGSITLYTI